MPSHSQTPTKSKSLCEYCLVQINAKQILFVFSLPYFQAASNHHSNPFFVRFGLNANAHFEDAYCLNNLRFQAATLTMPPMQKPSSSHPLKILHANHIVSVKIPPPYHPTSRRLQSPMHKSQSLSHAIFYWHIHSQSHWYKAKFHPHPIPLSRVRTQSVQAMSQNTSSAYPKPITL